MGLSVQKEIGTLDIPNTEVFRDNLISELSDELTTSITHVIIKGNVYMGKSTLLRHFALLHPKKTFMYSVKDDPIRDKVEYIVKEISEQFNEILELVNKEEIFNFSYQEAILFFEKSYVRLCKLAESNKDRYYLIIDGLEKLSDEVFYKLMEILPRGDIYSFKIIYSIASETQRVIPFQGTEILVGRFSNLETKQLLRRLNNNELIDSIHKFCNGNPGYINEVAKAIERNPAILENGLNEFSGFEDIFNKEWERNCYEEEDLKAFSLIYYSNQKIDVSMINSIPELSRLNEENNTFFVTYEDGLYYIPKIFRIYVEKKIHSYETLSKEILVNYYLGIENKSIDEMIYLTELFVENNNYEKIKMLIDTNDISKYIGDMKGSELLRDYNKLIASISYEAEDWATFLTSNLANSLINEVIKSPSTLGYEIQTLLAVEQYQEAINLAMLCNIEDDKCLFLSLICMKFKMKKIDVPNSILNEIENVMKKNIEEKPFNKEQINKWINISANLFPVKQELAMSIVKLISINNSMPINSDKLMDSLMFQLFLILDSNDERDSLQNIQSLTDSIENEKLKNFLYIVTSSSENTVHQVREKVQKIEDYSAKIFYLSSWCNNNLSNPVVIDVLLYLLREAEQDPNFVFSIRDLEVFVEALYSVGDTNEDKVKEVLKKFEVIENSIIQSPLKNYVRYKLIKVRLCEKLDIVLEDSIQNVFEYVRRINGEDIKFYCYIQILKTQISNTANEGIFKNEILDTIEVSFSNLLVENALKSEIVSEGLAELVEYDTELAFRYWEKLNTEKTRMYAMQKIMKKLINLKKLNELMIISVREKVIKESYDYILHMICKDYSFEVRENKLITINRLELFLLEEVRKISSSSIRILALAHLTVLFKGSDTVEEIVNEIKEMLSLTDSTINKKKISNIVFQELSLLSPDKSYKLYKELDRLTENNFNDNRISEAYFSILKLLIKMVPDLMKSSNSKKFITRIVELISICDSKLDKLMLLNALGLKLLLLNRNDLILEFFNQYVNLFEENIKDKSLFYQGIESSAVLLYFINKKKFLTLFENVEYEEFRDDAVINIIKYILTKKSSLESVDYEQLGHTIQLQDVNDVIELLELIQLDSKLVLAISALIKCLDNSMTTTNYTIRQGILLELVPKLSKIINKKLPNKRNITHDGYKTLSFVKIASLRNIDSIKKSVKNSLPDFPIIYSEIEKIPNISDKIYVLCELAIGAYQIDSSISHKCLLEAENLLGKITNFTDKIDRSENIINAFRLTGNRKAAEHLLHNIFSIINSNREDSYDYEDNVKDLIEIAHKISPELAYQLSKDIDSPNQKVEIESTLKTLDFHQKPSNLDGETKLSNKTLTSFYKKSLTSLHNNRGLTLSDEYIVKTLKKNKNLNVETTLTAIEWFIENHILRKKAINQSSLEELFNSVSKLADYSLSLDSSLISLGKSLFYKSNNYDDESLNSWVFKKGEGERAVDKICHWINESKSENLFIYDPYFSENDIELFKKIEISKVNKIYVISSFSTGGNLVSNEMLQKKYRKRWDSICDQEPPNIEFVALASKRGKTPMHDRFILLDKVCMKYGVSFNGMNSNDFSIEILGYEESNNIKNDIVHQTFISPPRMYEGEEITVLRFPL